MRVWLTSKAMARAPPLRCACRYVLLEPQPRKKKPPAHNPTCHQPGFPVNTSASKMLPRLSVKIMIKKRMVFATALVFLFTVAVRAQQVCHRHIEPAGGFSICIPEGWATQEKEGQKFKLLFGPRGQVFTANINFKDEVDPRPLRDYATAAIDY